MDEPVEFVGLVWPELDCPDCLCGTRRSHSSDVMSYLYCEKRCGFKLKIYPTGRKYRQGNEHWVEATRRVSVVRNEGV